MHETSTLPESIFALSTRDGQRTVRPNALVTFHVRVRNGTGRPSPAASVTLALPADWTALDAHAADVPPIDAGGEQTVVFRARACAAGTPDAGAPVQAVLRCGDTALGTNVVRMHVRGRARLNESGGPLRIEQQHDGAFRVAVAVINDGDAPARNVRLAAPVPPGFAAHVAATEATCAELAPGESLELAYTMETLAPAAAAVRIADAFAVCDGDIRVALAPGPPAVLAPALEVTDVDVRRRATRCDVRIRIANAGWVAAYDIDCSVGVPAGWHIARGTVLAGDAPLAPRRAAAGAAALQLVLPAIPARGFLEVTFVAGGSRTADGAVVVRCGAAVATAPIPALANRTLALAAEPASAFAEPGSSMPVAMHVVHAGDVAERATVMLDGTPCWTGALQPGASVRVHGHVTLPAGLRDGAEATLVACVLDADGAERARTAIVVRALERPWLTIDALVWDDGRVRVTLRNTGATAARAIRIVSGGAADPAGKAAAAAGDPAIGDLAPGAACCVLVDADVARDGSLLALGGEPVRIGWNDRERTAADVSICATPGVPNGASFDVRVRIASGAAMRMLRIRARALTAAPAIAGSTTVNGHALIEGSAGSPLFADDGLALHEIPAGTTVLAGWSVLPREPGPFALAVDVELNGVPLAVAPITVHAPDALPFAPRPRGLPFHIDAPTVADVAGNFDASSVADRTEPPFAGTPLEALPPEPEPSEPAAFVLTPDRGAAIVTALTLEPERAAALERVLRGERGSGLIGHLPSLALLFPTALASGDAALDAAFDAAATAIRGIYERLFVKLRIPGYRVDAGDLDDAPTRRALLDVLERIANAAGEPAGAALRGDVLVRIDRARIALAHAQLAAAPQSAPYALAATAVLLPRDAPSGAAGAIGAYAAALAGALETACMHPPDALVAVLATTHVPELDAARTLALVVLAAATTPATAAS